MQWCRNPANLGFHEIDAAAAEAMRERFKPYLGTFPADCACDLCQRLRLAMGSNLVKTGAGREHQAAATALIEACEKGTHVYVPDFLTPPDDGGTVDA